MRTEGLRWLKVPVILGALAGPHVDDHRDADRLNRASSMSMARDELLLPRRLSARVHAKFRTPHVATLVTGIASRDHRRDAVPIQIARASWYRSARWSPSPWSASACWCCATRVLAFARPFRVRAPWLVCTLGVVFCALMALSLAA